MAAKRTRKKSTSTKKVSNVEGGRPARVPDGIAKIKGKPFSIRSLGSVADHAAAHAAFAVEVFGANEPTAIQCPLYKDEVEKIVVAVIQSFHPNRTVTADKEFERDLMVDQPTRRLYLAPILERMADQGCRVQGVDPKDLEGCDTVQAVIDLVFSKRK